MTTSMKVLDQWLVEHLQFVGKQRVNLDPRERCVECIDKTTAKKTAVRKRATPTGP